MEERESIRWPVCDRIHSMLPYRASKSMRNAAAAEGSICLKRKAAAWDDDFRASLVAE